jgi:hypothetical protein
MEEETQGANQAIEKKNQNDTNSITQSRLLNLQIPRHSESAAVALPHD